METTTRSRRAFLRAVAAAGAGLAGGCATTEGTPRPRHRRASATEPSRPRTNISLPKRDAIPPETTAEPAPPAEPVVEESEPAEEVATRAPMEEGAVIRCAMIGVGGRGSVLLQALLEQKGVAVVAVADAYDIWRDRALHWCARRGDTRGYADYRDMLGDEDLDAVVIATPDHIHGPAVAAALEAGVDVYIEPPLSLHADEALALAQRARQTGAILQLGNQYRSEPMYQYAREIVQQGEIGRLVAVEVQRYYADQPLSEFDPPREATKENVHWKLFLGDTERVPFNLVRFFQWHRFKEYSHGHMGVLFAPHVDLCHFISGCGMPSQIMAVGAARMFDDGRTCPDTFGALASYPEGFQFNFFATPAGTRVGTVERYLGDLGSLEIMDMREMVILRRDAREEYRAKPAENQPHIQDFLGGVRTRALPATLGEAGFQEAACSAMVIKSIETGQALRWDPSSGTMAAS